MKRIVRDLKKGFLLIGIVAVCASYGNSTFAADPAAVQGGSPVKMENKQTPPAMVKGAPINPKQGFMNDMMKDINPSEAENKALKEALAAYSPAVKEAFEKVKATQGKLNSDLDITPPKKDLLSEDAMGVADARGKFKVAKDKLEKALYASLTADHLKKLQAKAAEHFPKENRDDAVSRVLFGYTMTLKGK